MLAQTKRAINMLLDCGLNRSDFSVRTNRSYVGKHPTTNKPMYEYTTLSITLFAPKETVYKALPLLAQHFRIYVYRLLATFSYPLIYEASLPKDKGIYLCHIDSLKQTKLTSTQIHDLVEFMIKATN